MMSLRLDPHSIDISVLRELHDPNFTSRYPPLHKRLPRLISIPPFNNQCERQKKSETSYKSNIVFDTDFMFKSSSIQHPLHIPRKRSRLMIFFKKLVKKPREKSIKIHTKNTICHSSISSHISLPFTDPLFPQQSTISIREDSEFEIFNTKSKSQRLNTNLLIRTSSKITPPINPQLNGVPNHSSEIIHQSIPWPSQLLSILGMASSEREISRLRERSISGERPGQHTELSDEAHVEDAELIARILPPDPFHSPQEQHDYQFCTQPESDKESYYSFTKSPAIGTDLREPASYFSAI
jgi:hypothetical protein